MTPDTATLLATYNRWMNQRLYDAAAQLPPVTLSREMGAFFGSILGTLNHIAVGDTIWLHRFSKARGPLMLSQEIAGYPLPTTLSQPIAGTLPALREYRERLDDLICRWADQLDAELLGSTLSYANTAGQARHKTLGALVLHFFNHQTHHRGQATTLLFQAGVDVGVTDLLAVIPDRPAGQG